MVGFEVQPASIDLTTLRFGSVENSCHVTPGSAQPQYVVSQTATSLFFTYSVEWRKSQVQWASRWDIYLSMRDVEIHWFSILNSLLIVFFLSGKFLLFHS